MKAVDVVIWLDNRIDEFAYFTEELWYGRMSLSEVLWFYFNWS